ncbi:hypothetical protein Bca4012_010453 [Brassica carinata]|uniref:Receptor ligand binding region domain-containing protein n=1 Tax=Brassica carinata TaxID=52824 RepID=A0A8X7S583_BRACI|nr:hypothetical protein Bca52824_035372 [Brassica carinata]
MSGSQRTGFQQLYTPWSLWDRKRWASCKEWLLFAITQQSVAWKRQFKERWKSGVNSYALYAYDSVWLIARALDVFFRENNNITFSNDQSLHKTSDSSIQLSLSVFNEGEKLLNIILGRNHTGVTGQIQFDSERNRVNPAYKVLNIEGSGPRRVGYWSNHSGEVTKPPRGWVFPNNGKPLKIAVPNRMSYKDYVSKDKIRLALEAFV